MPGAGARGATESRFAPVRPTPAQATPAIPTQAQVATAAVVVRAASLSTANRALQNDQSFCGPLARSDSDETAQVRRCGIFPRTRCLLKFIQSCSQFPNQGSLPFDAVSRSRGLSVLPNDGDCWLPFASKRYCAA